jgi:hypothetical protein
MANSIEADVAGESENLAAAKNTKADNEKKLTKRQRRKQINDRHKLPEMPKIQSPAARAKAYIRVAGLTESKGQKPSVDLLDPSVRFGRLLGSTDQRMRHQAVLQLENYLRQKCEIREDDSEEEASGISELDLLKLWKALWHTLYMADKAPVQHDLCKKLVKLLWCVAGTEEEDEYAAQVYLDMYGDDPVNGNEDSDVEGEDYTIEEMENTLEDEDEDDDDEEDASAAEGSEEEEDEEEDDEMEDEEEVAMEEDDVEGGLDDSEIPHCRGAHLASLFVRTFFRTVQREWGRMDKYRVDKFYSLVRLMVHEVFRYMSLRHWNIGIIRLFNDVIFEEVLSQTPNGLRFHLIDLVVDELAAVNADAPLPLTEATLVDSLEPYFAMAQTGAGDDIVQQRVVDGILYKFLEKYFVVSEEPASVEDEDGEPKSLVLDQVHVETVAHFIFSLGSDASTKDQYRKSLYDVHKAYMRAIKRAGKDACLGVHDHDDEEGDELQEIEHQEMEERRYDGDIDTPERQRKRKMTEEDEAKEISEEEPENGVSKKKRKKKKKKNKKKDTESEDTGTDEYSKTSKAVTLEEEGSMENASDTMADVDEVVKPKKKKKKKPRTSDEPGSEQSTEKEQITISVADQKAARKAMKKSTEKDTKSKSTTPKKAAVVVDSESERKRVKFGERNMARSWKASMKGLRTIAESPLPRPEKGILHKKDAASKKAKAKKARVRKTAKEYF